LSYRNYGQEIIEENIENVKKCLKNLNTENIEIVESRTHTNIL
jgi:hypothetical protein